MEVPEGQAEVEKSRLSLKIDGENVGQIMINHLGYSIFLDEPMLPVKGSSMFFFILLGRNLKLPSKSCEERRSMLSR